MIYAPNLVLGGEWLLVSLINSFHWRSMIQKDAKILEPERRAEIEALVQDLSRRMGISKKVKVMEIENLGGGSAVAQAIGNTFFFTPGIVINPHYFQLKSSSMTEFILAHELAHLSANHSLLGGIAASLAGIITTVALSVLFPQIAFSATVGLIGCAVGAIALILFSQWMEGCADRTAFSILSEESKKSVVDFHGNSIISNLEFRNDANASIFSKAWRRIEITSEGNERFEFFHPSLTDTYKYLYAMV